MLMSAEQQGQGSKIQCFSSVFCYLQNLVTGLDFNVVLDTIPELMNGLRMIWILSRHYNTDERLESLMERIAWELSERVARVVNVRVLFKWVSKICKSSSNHKPAVTCTKYENVPGSIWVWNEFCWAKNKKRIILFIKCLIKLEVSHTKKFITMIVITTVINILQRREGGGQSQGSGWKASPGSVEGQLFWGPCTDWEIRPRSPLGIWSQKAVWKNRLYGFNLSGLV